MTQQPLGGKAQFGGQRFERWRSGPRGLRCRLYPAGDADDQVRRCSGRVKVYESIVKGLPIEEPGIPASFKVLVKELQSLALSVEAVTDSGEVLHFGRDDRRAQLPKLGMGLLGLTPQNVR